MSIETKVDLHMFRTIIAGAISGYRSQTQLAPNVLVMSWKLLDRIRSESLTVQHRMGFLESDRPMYMGLTVFADLKLEENEFCVCHTLDRIAGW